MSSFLVAEGLLRHSASFMKPRYKEVGGLRRGRKVEWMYNGREGQRGVEGGE